jgi:hypothetical protein
MPVHKIVEEMRVRYRQGDAGAVQALAGLLGPYLRRIVRRALRSTGANSEFARRIQRLAESVHGRFTDSALSADGRVSQICERLCEAMLHGDPVLREALPAHETWFGAANRTLASDFA